MVLSYRFPEGRKKALTFSYDDGSIFDRRLVEIFNRYGMKGTFNLCSGLIVEKNEQTVREEELKALYKGHEIACHSSVHPRLELDLSMTVLDQILEDRKTLEKISGQIINGMAYPYGSYDQRTLDAMKAAGIIYSRTVNSTRSFGLPVNFPEWNPTCHHRDAEELADAFLKTNYPMALFYVWGHSYEFDRNNNWDLMERFCEKLAHSKEIWYATNGEIYYYIQALRSLVTSGDSRRIFNPSSQTVWLGSGNDLICVKGGETVSL